MINLSLSKLSRRGDYTPKQRSLDGSMEGSYHSAEYTSPREGPDMDLHLRAEKRFIRNQETDLEGLSNTKYNSKRVRVDRFSKEFSEARDRGNTADFLCGDVRRYILNMN